MSPTEEKQGRQDRAGEGPARIPDTAGQGRGRIVTFSKSVPPGTLVSSSGVSYLQTHFTDKGLVDQAGLELRGTAET